MPPSITIIGAGLGGLVLAGALGRRGIEAALYEAEASPEARGQGGLLDLHDEGGRRALRDLGLDTAFDALARPGEDAKRIVDRHGAVLLDRPGTGTRPEIERGTLRRLLLDALPPGTVRWGCKLVAAAPAARGGHVVTFADGTRIATTLLVGADGAWSRVRPLLTEARPVDTGVRFVEVRLAADDPRAVAAAPVIGAGTLMAVAPGQGILAHRHADGSIHGYAAIAAPNHRMTDDPGAAIMVVAARFADWAPSLRALIAFDGPAPVVRAIHALPAGLRWPRRPGVTLVGDAAHLMSPFAGEGANLAMRDATDLADALAARPDDPDAALAAYEDALFPRSARLADASARNLERFFGPDAPASVVDLFAGH